MVELNFYVSDEDFDRLCEIKEKQDKGNLSVNDFARELLEMELYRLCPRPSAPEEE